MKAATAAKRSAPRKPPDGAASPPTGLLGAKLRTERERQGIALRELARRLGMSPSLISQIERGLVTPSVGTLWSITTELGMVMEELFRDAERVAPAAPAEGAMPAPTGGQHVQRSHDRKRIRLAGGIVWERLTAQEDEAVEFIHVTYEPGAESCPENSFFRHGGKEYAYLLEGRLGVQIGFERYELAPGDSISFQSQLPHRLWAIGETPAVAIWIVLNRHNDSRR